MTTENPVLKKIEEKDVKKIQRLLPAHPSKVTEEVQQERDKLADFGIRNKSYKYLKQRISEEKKSEEGLKAHNAETSVLHSLSEKLFPFRIVSYNVMHEIAVENGFIIAPLFLYNEAIPDVSIEELSTFKERFSEFANGRGYTKFQEYVTFHTNDFFSFITDTSFERQDYPSLHTFYRYYSDIDFKSFFKILAPADHFEIPKGYIRVGNEVNYAIVKKPKLNLSDIKLAEFPVPKFEDPVIFPTFRFSNKVYCIVVTAWDKIADDSRIRSLI